MTVREAVRESATKLEAAGVEEALRDAQALVLHVLGREKTWLLAHGDEAFPAEAATRLQGWVERRATREPLQYILGEQEFYGLRFAVTPAVLIPRPETELLVEAVELWATQQADARTLAIVDVGTGSGAIAIALATHVAAVEITAVEISSAALAVAEQNARTHQAAVRFVLGDLLEGFATESFDCVVSNPPYVPALDASGMQREVVEHEPHTALFAGEDGLAIYRRLIPEAERVLRAGGLLAMEFGFGQREALAGMLAGWREVRFIDDLAGIPRHVLATRPT